MIADFLANLGNDSLLADSLVIPAQNPLIDYVVPLNILCILEFIRFARSKTNRLIFFAWFTLHAFHLADLILAL